MGPQIHPRSPPEGGPQEGFSPPAFQDMCLCPLKFKSRNLLEGECGSAESLNFEGIKR